jgi:integrase
LIERWTVSQTCLFFTLGGDFGHMSGNSIRRAKSIVERDIGKRFEYRDCRRAYGDMYLKKGATIEQVSVAMGHASTEPTETYYCRKSESQVNRELRELW